MVQFGFSRDLSKDKSTSISGEFPMLDFSVIVIIQNWNGEKFSPWTKSTLPLSSFALVADDAFLFHFPIYRAVP
jgi:hypothetical protein